MSSQVAQDTNHRNETCTTKKISSSFLIITSCLLCFIAAGEQVSEEEESGVDEDFDSTTSAPDGTKLDKRKGGAKEKNATKTLLPRYWVITVAFAV